MDIAMVLKVMADTVIKQGYRMDYLHEDAMRANLKLKTRTRLFLIHVHHDMVMVGVSTVKGHKLFHLTRKEIRLTSESTNESVIMEIMDLLNLSFPAKSRRKA